MEPRKNKKEGLWWGRLGEEAIELLKNSLEATLCYAHLTEKAGKATLLFVKCVAGAVATLAELSRCVGAGSALSLFNTAITSLRLTGRRLFEGFPCVIDLATNALHRATQEQQFGGRLVELAGLLGAVVTAVKAADTLFDGQHALLGAKARGTGLIDLAMDCAHVEADLPQRKVRCIRRKARQGRKGHTEDTKGYHRLFHGSAPLGEICPFFWMEDIFFIMQRFPLPLVYLLQGESLVVNRELPCEEGIS